MYVYVFTYKASGNTVGMSVGCGSHDRYSKQAKGIIHQRHSAQREHMFWFVTQDTRYRKKNHLSWSCWNVIKYASTVLIFYGNRKSIEWHQNQPHPTPPQTWLLILRRVQNTSLLETVKIIVTFFTSIDGITCNAKVMRGQLEKGTNYINTSLQKKNPIVWSNSQRLQPNLYIRSKHQGFFYLCIYFQKNSKA